MNALAPAIPWVKMPTVLLGSPILRRAGEDAELVFYRGWLYCGRFATDGRITAEAVADLAHGLPVDPAEMRGRLIDAGLWVAEPDGAVTVAHYLEAGNLTAERRTELFAARRMAGQLGGQASAQARAQASAQAKFKQRE